MAKKNSPSSGQTTIRSFRPLSRAEAEDVRPSYEMAIGEVLGTNLVNISLVLLADEPTGNLDPVTASYVFDALSALVKQSGLAAMIATHNHELAGRMDRRVTLSEGKVVPL